MKTKRDRFCDFCREYGLLVDAAQAITAFVREVDQRAEQKMLLTGKLEGSHKAAMDELLKQWGLK